MPLLLGEVPAILVIFNDLQTGPLVIDEVSSFRRETRYPQCWKVL